MVEVTSPEGRGAGSMRFVQKIYLAVAILAMVSLAFLSTFFGYWSPHDIVKKNEVSQVNSPYPDVEIVALPQLAILLPGPELKTLIIGISLEITLGNREHVEHLTPRLLDAFRSLISEIEPFAFEKVGILDAIRDELSVRATYILGDQVIKDILITEFLV